ncbi:hypothetical protein [uncultured Shewanella sp.]|uniref:hypothetical protein n=1 Tax=uncultured Shewanella sp. TaxID=173975 RepID=UPI00262BA0E4|nr:hypothetical protein [uncultured Shewanella sp.]
MYAQRQIKPQKKTDIKKTKSASVSIKYDKKGNLLLNPLPSMFYNKLAQASCIQKLQIIDGSGFMSEDRLTQWLQNKAWANADEQHVRHCAQYILAHNGTTTGGGTAYQVGGKTVFHISHGIRDRDDGCTVFFVCNRVKANNNDDKGIAYIVGVGHHTGPTSYRLDWGCGQGAFNTGANINL